MASLGLLRARTQITFVIGLALASAVLILIEQREYVPVADIQPISPILRPAPPELRTAWEALERGRDSGTGLTAAEPGGDWTTLGGVGHTIKATLAAHRLGFIDGRDLYTRVAMLLTAAERVGAGGRTGRISIRTGTVIDATPTDAPDAFIAAVELVAWSYPANAVQARAVLRLWADMPPEASVASLDTPLRRAAQLMLQGTMHPKGETE